MGERKKKHGKEEKCDGAFQDSGNDGDVEYNSSSPSEPEPEELGLELLAESKGGGVQMLQYRMSGRSAIALKIDKTSDRLTWTKIPDDPDEENSDSDTSGDDVVSVEEESDAVSTTGSVLIKDIVAIKQG